MRKRVRVFVVLLAALGNGIPLRAQLKTQNVVLIVSDGLRWQEVFTGTDPDLISEKHGGIWASPEKLRSQFWSSDPARPNITVFEWMNQFPEFHGRVAAYATWEVFKNIFNEPRSHLPMQAGWDLPEKGNLTPRQELLNELYRTTTRLDDEDVWDSFLQVPLLEYVKSAHPRLLFVGYGETDNWAHSGRYDLVLESAHQFDDFVRQLWETMQSMPEYRDQTTFIITTDHGRGSGPEEWKEHGIEQKGSENIWIAVLGPDTQPLGELSNNSAQQAQIAATLAEFLGKDFVDAVHAAAPSLSGVISHR